MTLLHELRNDAIDPKVDILTVLRRARVLAAKLNNPDFLSWIKSELDGYPAGADLPKYRLLNVEAKAHLILGFHQMPHAAVMASMIPEDFRHWATTARLGMSISEIASLIHGYNDSHGGLSSSWPQEIAVKFGGAGYGGGRTRVQCIRAWQEISVAALVGIAETVRNRLLEFILQIDAEAPDAGEVGPGETSLPQERVTQIFHTYISGGTTHIAGSDSSHVSNSVQVGSMTNSDIQQAGAGATQSLSFSSGSDERADLERLLREISEHFHELNLDEKARRKADAQIATMQAQLADDEPDGGIIAQAGSTLRNVTEGAIGSLIANAAQPLIWHWVAQAMATLFAK